jgi:hypothetical protein
MPSSNTTHVFVPPAPDPEEYLKRNPSRSAVVRTQCRCAECMTYPAAKGSGAWNIGGSRWAFEDGKWRRV